MGKSSKDKRDVYYRLAKEQNWRARSAFKLIQIDEQFDLFDSDPGKGGGVTRVVDLCAAPGSWSQVLSRILIKGESFGRRAWVEKQKRERNIIYDDEKLEPDESGGVVEEELNPRKDVKIVAIDLQPMAPLQGVVTLKADITAQSTIPLLLKALDPDCDQATASTQANHPVDVVLSDGAPDVTGLHDLDIYIQSQLLFSALNLAICVLKPGGKFVAKIFRGKDVDLIYAQLKLLFEKVTVAKPRSSRASSLEAFVVCEGYFPPKGFKASLENPIGTGKQIPIREKVKLPGEIRDESAKQKRTVKEDGTTTLELESDNEDECRWVADFLACGDLSAWDADATYKLPEGHVSLDPVQPPTAPPYKTALERRKAAGGAYGKTTNKDKGKA
jgi:tRNA (cytidine32/guanosine34-2'-O)-methyltransferase